MNNNQEKVYGQIMGGSVQEFPLSEARTVGDVRRLLGVASDHVASVNGRPADNSTYLSNFNVVTFAKSVTGGR